MKSSRKRLGIGECPHYETRPINIHKVPFYYPPNSLEIVKITHFYTIEFHPTPFFLSYRGGDLCTWCGFPMQWTR